MVTSGTEVRWGLGSREVYERLVGSPAFKAGGTGQTRPAGSIPVHLRRSCGCLQGIAARSAMARPRLDCAAMKKLIVLAVVVVLAVLAVKKLQDTSL